MRILQSPLRRSLRSLLVQKIRLNFSASNPRDIIHFDAVAIGGGPAGLSFAIRLKQIAKAAGQDVSVCVVDKGAEIGAHILSGNVFESRALSELIPNWKDLGAPLDTAASHDEFFILSKNSALKVPHILLPPQLNNSGNYIISLSQLVRWLAAQAEELGVEIYPGFAASEVLYDDKGDVKGVATRDSGISKDGSLKDSYARGVEIHAKHTVFAEGARGSCSEEVINKYQLRKGKDVQTYGLGLKEVWQIPENRIQPGYIQHTLGWPLQDSVFSNVFGGSFLYHMKPNIVMLGIVVGLDYQNPYLNPYKEFQRWKEHPEIRKHLEGGECISYGARVLNEGGWHAVPKLTMPGGSLIGCSAGFVNSGSHTAMKSGMLAAEALYPELIKSETVASSGEVPADFNFFELSQYEDSLKSSWIGDELKQVRNSHAAFHYGLLPGMIHTAFSCFITRGSEPWTLTNSVKDSDRTLPASKCQEINYPKADGKLTFDLLTNLQRSGTSHDHDQPAHLRVKNHLKHVPSDISITTFAGPEQRFCPAGVYEYSEAGADSKRSLIINAQNCLHCKCCSIKSPKEYIDWTVPEGGGGPAYVNM